MALVCFELDLQSSVLSGRNKTDDEIWPLELTSSPWRLLSRDLLHHHILPRLPILPLLRLRSVCRSWLSLLSSPSFWSLWSLFHPFPPPLLLYLAPPSPLASPPASKHLARWRQSYASRFAPSSRSAPTPSHAPGRWHCLRCFSTSFLAARFPFSILSSDGGLLLLESRSSREFIVYNPLSKAYRALPPVRNPNFDFGAIISVNSELGEYVVIFLGCERGVYLVYESITRQYKLALVDRGRNDSLCRKAEAIRSRDFHWLPNGYDDMNSSYVLFYDRQHEALCEIRTHWPRNVVLPEPRQIWCDSQGLMTVALCEQRVGIWKLSSTTWSLLETLPSDATESGIFSDKISCVKIGDSICLSTPYSGRVFLYDTLKKTWEWSYRCPDSRNLAAGFAFEPRPHAEV